MTLLHGVNKYAVCSQEVGKELATCHLCDPRYFESSDFEYCVVLAYYATNSGNFLPTFRDNLSERISYLLRGVLTG